MRAEVFEHPAGNQSTGWTLCYIANVGANGDSYGCADTDYYKSTGVFEREVKMTTWWNNDKINWADGIKQMDLIYAIDDSGMGPADWNDLTGSMRTGLTPAVQRPNPFEPHVSTMAPPAVKLEAVPEAQTVSQAKTLSVVRAGSAKDGKPDVIPCDVMWWVFLNAARRDANGLAGRRSSSGRTTRTAPSTAGR